ncbi:ABC transporter permease [Actinomadura chibensis]|uniref:Transport permease protein n=1 Tax=Actinomadura chibensis TaxID=392828 RepID=A0A5D0NQN7_9ACTN|nr:ABC transporter permease [Actinomadura chibensis]TYB46391.1 ABC transporter [Actinomadura chibensis]
MTLTAISLRRVTAVAGRNVGALRSGPQYWAAVLSGVFEPLMYMLAIGGGVGSLMVSRWAVDGHEVPYLTYVAPGVLASAAMSGAIAETVIHFFFKLRYQKTFEGMSATPVRPVEIVLGELGWAVTRSAAYVAVFLMIMAGMAVTTPVRAAVTLPAGILVALAFAALGMCVSTLLRGWQDLDLVIVAQLALFLFSGTFAPVDDYPGPLRAVVEALPLYHGVELTRGLAVGGGSAMALAGHALYLSLLTAVSVALAAVRMRRMLQP